MHELSWLDQNAKHNLKGMKSYGLHSEKHVKKTSLANKSKLATKAGVDAKNRMDGLQTAEEGETGNVNLQKS